MDEPKPLTLTVDADISPLKSSLLQAESLLKQLDRAVSQHSNSIAATLNRVIGSSGGRRTGSILEQLAAPALNQAIGGFFGQTTDSGIGRSSPVNIAMNIATPDAGSFRLSQGQIAAEAASAIALATRRFL